MTDRFDPRRLLIALRDGKPPDLDDIRRFAAGLGDGSLSDAQVGAFAMAVCQRGLGEAGRVALTEAMRDSGDVQRWDLPGPVVDKHSTGGIGDSTSLLLAPALAACGAYVPMISGRGLGHCGGTLDKLQSIPGYQVDVGVERLRQVTEAVGSAIVGPSGRIAPADKRLYFVRDVTGTVESIDLITSSILSKKLAAGLSALILDVKVGSGSFMTDMGQARALAQSMVETANGAGCKTRALITDMDQPLAASAGNAVEVAEVMRCLTLGRAASPRMWDLTLDLGAELLVLAGLAADEAEGAAKLEAALTSGAAAERFGQMVAALGGPSDFLPHWQQHLPKAPVERDVFAGAEGKVQSIDGRTIGMAVIGLGGGRLRESDAIDPSVGFSSLAYLGDQVGPQQPLGRVHARTEDEADRASAALRAAYHLGEAGEGPLLVRERVVSSSGPS